MRATQIDFAAFGPEHLESALALSRQAGWPHRLEDWRMMHDLSVGTVARDGERVIGTAFTTLFGSDCATINMVIVDEAARGRGLGRRLMDRALAVAGSRTCRLVATKEGLPLYEKLGFREIGTILQHQAVAGPAAMPAGVDWAAPAELDNIAALDRAAFGADRGALITSLKQRGQFAVIRRDGKIVGFAALRLFGRGEVIGPVIADNAVDARSLIAFLIAARPGKFLRVDTTAAAGLSDWLSELGLTHVGGGIAMGRDSQQAEENGAHQILAPQIYALASQALG